MSGKFRWFGEWTGTVAFAILFVAHCGAQQPPVQFASPEGCPEEVSEPVGVISPTDFVEIQSLSGCFDACPVYSIKIQADGEVTWNGERGVLTQGPASRHVPSEDARALIESYRAKGFWRVCHLTAFGEDGPELVTTVRAAGLKKSTRGTPDWKIFRATGILAGTYAWIRGEPAMESVDRPIASANDFAPKPGLTNLMAAVLARDVERIEKQLIGGANVNARDSSGFTALMYASQGENTQIVKMLLHAGADPNIRSNLGQTAMMAASAFAIDRSANVRVLIAAGAEVNAQDLNGNSALMLAVTPINVWGRPKASTDVVELLVQAGARRGMQNKEGATALRFVEQGLSFLGGEFEMLETMDEESVAARRADLGLKIGNLENVRRILAGK